MPPDPPSRHTRLRICGRAFTRYYHPATIPFPPSPNSKSCMKPGVETKWELHTLPVINSWSSTCQLVYLPQIGTFVILEDQTIGVDL